MADQFEELQSLEEEFEGFEELGVLGLDPQSHSALQEVDQLAQELGLDAIDQQVPMTLSALTSEGPEGQAELQFIGSFIKNKVKKLLAKLVKLIKKHKKCIVCTAAVLNALKLFKSGKFFAALKAAYDALKCIKKCAT